MSDNEYMRQYMAQYSMKRKEKIHALLGGKCVECGSIENLEADHIDPSQKIFTLSKGWHHSWNKVITEALKCQLLCEECHKKKHSSSYSCGTPQRYWRGCRCEGCTKANTDYNREYKKRRGV